MRDQLLLNVEGTAYGGWQDVRVTRMLETIAGSFALKVSDKWGSLPMFPWPIRPEDECAVFIDDQQVIDGWVDVRDHRYDAESHDLGIEGRDLGGILVDCSVDLSLVGSEFLNIGVREFCQRICEPFGIGVYLQDGLSDSALSTTTGTGKAKVKTSATAVGSAGTLSIGKIGTPYSPLTISAGEKAFAAIERACRIVGVLPMSDGQGGICLSIAGGSVRCTTALEEGINILSAGVRYDASQRFAKYIAVGQAQLTDEQNGASAVAVQGLPAIDKGVRRTTRVLVVDADAPMPSVDFATRRAAWVMTVQNGRASQISVNVQGWTQADGTIWPLNARVPFTSKRLGVDDELLIVGTQFSKSLQQGTVTTLTLARPDAYAPESLVTSKSAPGWGFKGAVEQGAPL